MLFRLEALSLSPALITVLIAFLNPREELNPVESLNVALEVVAYSVSILGLPSNGIVR